ncbi:MAG TPA: hypothetical protein GXX29_09195 [Firmicutes bacterium]|nr:hypothetical protein [Bacillota bacterium]
MVKILPVYNDGRHNAFTSLTEWQGRLYVAFRSGTRHVIPGVPDGRVRVLSSEDDGLTWTEVALLAGAEEEPLDMRDPKLLATPERLYIHSFGYRDDQRRDAYLCWTEDGLHFTPFQRALREDNLVIWWPVYHDGQFFGAGYRYNSDKRAIYSLLYNSADGVDWQVQAVISDVPYSNETALLFLPDKTAVALVRHDGYRLTPPTSNGHPVLAKAKPPYHLWVKKELPILMAGMCFHLLDDCTYLIAARVFDDDGTHTALFHYDENTLTRLYTLPSGGDTSYAGMVRKGSRLLMSYYSSHEQPHRPEVNRPAGIYIADIDIAGLIAEAGLKY